MNRLKLLTKALFAAPVITGLTMLSAYAGSATYNFDTTLPTDVWVGGSAPVGWVTSGGNPGGFLDLTDAVNAQNTVVIFPDFDAGMIVKAFTFSCDLRIGNPVGNSGRPADGFSISYARASDPILSTDHFGDANYFAAAGQSENGTSTGVAISFDAWEGNALPDGADVQGLIVRVDNATVLKQAMPTRHGATNDVTSLQTGPWDGSTDVPDGTGDASILSWVKLEVELNDAAQLTVKFKGTNLLDHYQTDFKPSAGRLVMAGRTGDANENQHVDNVVISTTAAEMATITGVSGTGVGFTATIEDVGNSVVDPATMVVKLNGTVVTPALSKAGTVTTLAYSTLPVILPSGSTNTVDIAFKDTRGFSISGSKSFVTGSYTTIPAEYAVSASAVDKTKPGFAIRMTQIPIARYPVDENYIANGERQLAGGYINPATSQPYANIANLSQAVNGLLVDEGVINWNWESTEYGDFTSANGFQDQPIPGIPGTTSSTDHTSAEITTYLDLKAGLYTFGVNSDDGFKLSTARDVRDTVGLTLGFYNGGRGTADTLFQVAVSQDGIYPIRLSWWSGNGGANCEFFYVAPGGTNTLINDLTAAAPIKAYRSSTNDLPHVVSVEPGVEQPVTWPTANIVVQIEDGATQVKDGSVQMTLDGATVSPTVTKTGTRTTVTLPSSSRLASDSTHKVTLSYQDTGSPAATYDGAWQFYVATYTTLDVATSSPVGSGDATKPGFSARIYQLDQPGSTTMQNLCATTEQELAGIVGANVADLSKAVDGIFAVTNVINWSVAAPEAIGHFTADNGYVDELVPGIPGTGKPDYNNNNIAAELVTYLEFPAAGFYAMGVCSDDGFRVTATDKPPVYNQALVVSAPASVAGAYYAMPQGSDIGLIAAPVTVPISAKIVAANPEFAATDLTNAEQVKGNICLLRRGGGIAYTDKLARAKKAGAIAAIIANNRCPGWDQCTDDGSGDWPGGWGGTFVDIPGVAITTGAGAALFNACAQGDVLASITPMEVPSLGEYNGGRGAGDGDTWFYFLVPQAGVYPFRCAWCQGGDPGSVEWFMVGSDDTRTLINDTKTGAIKAYRARTLTPVTQPTIAIAVQGGNVVLTFTGTLQSADSVTGPWSDVTGATSPKTVSVNDATVKFYRAKSQ